MRLIVKHKSLLLGLLALLLTGAALTMFCAPTTWAEDTNVTAATN